VFLLRRFLKKRNTPNTRRKCHAGICQRHLVNKEIKMATGTVKWFNPTKGFGFIQPDAGGADVFVHISAVQRAGLQDLREGQKVNYELVTERGKTAAANLQVADAA
jgi:CspA family cold shock protein